MSHFKDKTITNKGLELLSAALAGELLEFTRLEMGAGTYSGDMASIESLVNPKQSLNIQSMTRKGSQVILSSTLVQVHITENFYWKEIGVYAKGKDGLEVLYMYGSATDTSFISKDMLNEKIINIGILVSNAQNIAATIDNSLVFLTQVDLDAHDKDENAHEPLRNWVQSLIGSGDWAKYAQAVDIQNKIGQDTDSSTKNTLFGWLGSIRAKIDAFVAQYTSARAAKLDKLDNLDTTISSRAPASTALTTGVWTNARATKVDNLDTSVSSRAPANTALSTSTWTAARAAALDNIGATGNTGGSATAGTVMAKLNTLITTLNNSSVVKNGTTIKSIQRGVSSISGVSSQEITISSVNVNKAMVNYLGFTMQSTTNVGSYHRSRPYIRLVNGTTLQLVKGDTSNAIFVSWEVIEFY